MTPAERALEIVMMCDVSLEAIEAQIVAAIEGEREACAKLIEKQAAGFQVLIDHAPTSIRIEDMKRLKHALEVAADCVRSRTFENLPT
jgi:hypothetical protein